VPAHSSAPALRVVIYSLLASWMLCSCSGAPTASNARGPHEHAFRFSNLAKTDIDEVAEAHLEASLAGVKLLMEKLYRRNPRELRKGGFTSIDAATQYAFDRNKHWRFKELQDKRGIDALQLAFRPEFSGDRVFAFGVGLASMLHQSYNEQYEFYFMDKLDPQALYNSARNIEIAAWKLSNDRDAKGDLLLLSNGMNGDIRNLSFEREFGKLIGGQDFLAALIAQRSNRTLRMVVQNIATAIFIPLH
jgi:hypothetical protein